MKTLKVLTIVAVTGVVGVMTLNAQPINMEKCKMMKQQCNAEKKAACKSYKGMNKHHKMRKNPMIKIFRELDLTGEQRATLKANRQARKMQRKAEREKMFKERKIEKFVTVDGFDREAFIQSATQNSKRMIEMRADKFETMIGVLTPEQRLKLIELLKAEK